MQQTILALAALLCFAYLTLGQQRGSQDVERRAVTRAIELAAADLARARMVEVERLAFDEEDTGRQGIRLRPSKTALGADAGESVGSYDDVDDWNSAGTIRERVPVGSDSLSFDVRVTVRYVKDDDPAATSSTPTFTKQVEVAVAEAPAPVGRPAATATLRRVVTPASVGSY